MALANRRRSALADIPIQMSELRVSTDNIANNSPLDNIPIGYLTPTPSQDEIVIQQRGRRRILINWSPEKPAGSQTPTSSATAVSSMATRSPLLHTPTKATTAMTLRSSPRKRLYTPERRPYQSPDPNNLNGSLASPRLLQSPFNHLSYSPQSKRSRTPVTPIGQLNNKASLNRLLKGLSNAQLIGIIQSLVDDEPQLERKIRSNFPTPDTRPLEEQLITLKKNIFKSLPTSRLVKATDSVAHSRVATHLATFKKTIVDQSRMLNDSENWDALLDYCLLAWNYVKSTPVWENNNHNAMRRSCFKVLSWHCLCAIKSGGILLGEQRLSEFYSNIQSMKNDCDDIGLCVSYLNDIINNLHNQTI